MYAITQAVHITNFQQMFLLTIVRVTFALEKISNTLSPNYYVF